MSIDAKHNWLYKIGNLDQFIPEVIHKRKLYQLIMRNFSVYNIFLAFNKTNNSNLVDWSIRKVILQLRNLKLLCAREDIKLMIIFHPSKKGHRFNYERIIQSAEELNIPHIELSQARKASQGPGAQLRKGPPFYTEEGHKIIALKIYDNIKEFL